MGIEVTRMLRHHPEFLRDPEAFRRATGASRFVTGRDGQRERIADDNALIITTSGMLAGGPVHSYLPKIRANPMNAITLTGYQVEGTPGSGATGARPAGDQRAGPAGQRPRVVVRLLRARGPGRGWSRFSTPIGTRRVLVVHGDRCEAFAEDLRVVGFEANAPALGDRIEV